MSDDKYLKLLAVATVSNPRGTTKDLAEAVGISKATFHRLYGTRENLINILQQKCKDFIDNIIKVAEVPYDDYKKGLHALIESHYEGNEYLLFTCSTQGYDINEMDDYSKAIDLFFLRGQKKGSFKIDISAQALTEFFVSNVCIMIDAQRRGRIASANMLETIEKIFLYGASS